MDSERSAELEALNAALTLTRGAAPDGVAAVLSGGDICAASRTPESERSVLAAGWSVACLLLAVIMGVALDAPVRGPRPSRTPARVDLAKLDAISRAQDWVPAGDELSVGRRVGAHTRHPGGARAWSAERLSETHFLVLYRDLAGAAYAFEVDRRSGVVTPTPEAVDGLTVMRVEEERALGRLVASLSDEGAE